MTTNITKNEEEIKINSNIIKTGLMQYYRFGLGASAVCTELSTGIGISDVMVINRDGEVVEIEVKISKSDLLVEKKNKDVKHLLLEKSGGKYIFTKQSYCNCKPNRFYFCIPDYLVDDAIAFASELNHKYGVRWIL